MTVLCVIYCGPILMVRLCFVLAKEYGVESRIPKG